MFRVGIQIRDDYGSIVGWCRESIKISSFPWKDMTVNSVILIGKLVDLGSMSGSFNPSTVRLRLLVIVPCSSSMDVSSEEALVL